MLTSVKCGQERPLADYDVWAGKIFADYNVGRKGHLLTIMCGQERPLADYNVWAGKATY
jgi:hypothetical protein